MSDEQPLTAAAVLSLMNEDAARVRDRLQPTLDLLINLIKEMARKMILDCHCARFRVNGGDYYCESCQRIQKAMIR
jgi:hypothetical protein